MHQRIWTFPLILLTMSSLILCAGEDPSTWALAQSDGAAVNGDAADNEESPLLSEPESLEEHFDAVILMVRLARPNLARKYLEQFMALQPDDDDLLALRDQHGPAVFLMLSNVEALRPLSSNLLERVTRAFRERGAAPERIDALIADLGKSAQEREVALLALRSAGPIAVPRILKHLGSPASKTDRNLLLYTLTRLGEQAVPPLLGALDSPDENLRAVVVEALGWIGSKEVVPYLWYPAFSPDQSPSMRATARTALSRILETSESEVEALSSFGVAAELQRTALDHFRYKYDWKLDDEGHVPLWTWVPQEEGIAQVRLTPQTASLHVGSRLARQALMFAQEKSDVQSLYLGMALASEAHRSGWNRPLPTGPGTAHDLALSAGPDVVSEALHQALAHGNPEAARATLQALGQIGTRQQLQRTESRQSPIIAALSYPDQRVQFAAASTVLQLDPETPFRNSDRIVRILARSLNDSGFAQAVVVDVDTQRATAVASFLSEMGFDANVVSTGRDGFRAASERNDVELIALNANTIRWPLSQTIINLRADTRTANTPIVVYGPADRRAQVVNQIERFPFTTFVLESATSDNFSSQLRPFLQTVNNPAPTAEERQEQRRLAAFWLAHIANGQRTKLYPLAPAEVALFESLNEPELASNSLIALGAIPTMSAQRRLQSTVLSQAREMELRELAAMQLAFHVQRFGLLLDEQQLAELHTAWKTTNERGLSTALTAVIGSLKPNSKQVGTRLQEYALPPVPQPEP